MRQKTKSESPAHKKLADELVSLLPGLDEDGLAFLVEQARVHLYNMEIDRQEAEDRDRQKTDSADALSKGSAPRDPANFRIERSGSGSSYHIISGGNWKMYNEDEMMQIVRIASAPGSVREIATRLHGWFTRERPDTFADLEIGDELDPRLDELVALLRSKFTIKTK